MWCNMASEGGCAASSQACTREHSPGQSSIWRRRCKTSWANLRQTCSTALIQGAQGGRGSEGFADSKRSMTCSAHDAAHRGGSSRNAGRGLLGGSHPAPFDSHLSNGQRPAPDNYPRVRSPCAYHGLMPSSIRRSLAGGWPVRAEGGRSGRMNTHCCSVNAILLMRAG